MNSSAKTNVEAEAATFIKKPFFTHMILSGGGALGQVYPGVFRYLYQEGLHTSITTVAGTSVGAMVAIAFVLGHSMEQMKSYLTNMNEDLVSFDIMNALTILDSMGLCDGEKMVERAKIDHVGNMTFLELAKKTGKNLIICATRVKTMTPIYFSVDNTPHVRVVDALQASMAIPLLVKPTKIGDELYIDGLVTHCIPIKAIPSHIPKENILIVSLYSEKKDPESSQSQSTFTSDIGLPQLSKVGDFMSYVLNILNTIKQNHESDYHLQSTYPYYLKLCNIPLKQFEMHIKDNKVALKIPTAETADIAAAYGYEQIHEFMLNKIYKTPKYI